jgi:outer membrane immunogenic protein
MVFYTFDLRPSGAALGGHVGYNRQVGPWVFGIEGDIAAIIDAHSRAFDPAGSGRYDEVAVLWSAHVRGRIGHTFTDCLIYLAGGLALADVKASLFAPGMPLWSQTETRVGFSIGGGFEKRLGWWRLRLEYLFDRFDSKRFDWVSGTRYSNSDLSLHTVRVGASFPLGGPM